MSFQPGELVEVTTEGVAHGGWCVARPSGLPVVFVRHALPGERVVARVTEVTRSLARAEAVEILDASPDRVVAPCPNARPAGCGGCDWQHATLPAQRELKAAVVREQLRRLAGIDREVRVEPLPGDEEGGAGHGLGWRTRVQFAVDSDGMAGLRAHRSHEVFDIGDCLIAHPGIRDLEIPRRQWPGASAVEAAVGSAPTAPAPTAPAPAAPGSAPAPTAPAASASAPAPAASVPQAPGDFAEREVIVVLDRDRARQGRGAGAAGGRSVPEGPEGTLDAATELDVPAESVLRRNGRKLTPVRGRPYLTQHAAGREWRVSAGAFWQVHPAAADTLTAAVLAALEPKPGDTVLDLYCGAGLFAGALAEAVGPDGAVIGVEGDEAAARDARHNLRDFRRARIHVADVGAILRGSGGRGDRRRQILPPARLAVADPPRSGLDRAVIGYLSSASSGTERFCYVSCDPATLARDIGLLVARGWTLEGLRAFDAFPMTHHVECVALLAR